MVVGVLGAVWRWGIRSTCRGDVLGARVVVVEY